MALNGEFVPIHCGKLRPRFPKLSNRQLFAEWVLSILRQQADDLLIVAHLNGRLASLDLATGQRRGQGFAIQASAAPAAAPVPFGADRIFAPLTDGTVLLLPFDELETK